MCFEAGVMLLLLVLLSVLIHLNSFEVCKVTTDLTNEHNICLWKPNYE